MTARTDPLEPDPLAGVGSLVFDRVLCIDFEFVPSPGGNRVVCMSVLDALTGEVAEYWEDELGPLPPFPIDARTLVVAHYALAEMACFEALHWLRPACLLDTWVERRHEINGWPGPTGLLATAAAHGLSGIPASEKEEMRALILGGGPWSPEERQAIQAYCTSDVAVLAALLREMWPTIAATEKTLKQALFRGTFMAISAAIEARGIPVDTATLRDLQANWTELKLALVAEVDRAFGVYDGTSFRLARFECYLAARNWLAIWPKLASGTICLDRDTFKEMAARLPAIEPLRVLRNTLAELKLNSLQPSADGRIHANPRPFASRTARSQPSSSESIYGLPKWVRHLIRPEPGTAIINVDYTAQEVAIAAALSGDAKLWAAYQSGDVYLAFAKQAGLVPPDGRREDYKAERNRCKAVVLGTQYGQSAYGIARRAGIRASVARDLLNLHRQTYRAFWRWSDAITDRAMLGYDLRSTLGWRISVPHGPGANPRTYRNWAIQSGGSDILRAACVLLDREGVRIIATIHDAIVVEAPAERVPVTLETTLEMMKAAGRIVLGPTYDLKLDPTITRYPSGYIDEGGSAMWAMVLRCLAKVGSVGPAPISPN